MARLTGALFSLAASGTIADTLTFAKWKGIQYVRTRVIPANPKSDAQVEVRNVFRFLNSLWNRMPAAGRLPWETATSGLAKTDRNLLIGENVPALIDEANLAAFVWTKGHGPALRQTSVALTTLIAGELRAVFVVPTAPDGLTLTHCCIGAIPDGVPGDAVVRRMFTMARAQPDLDFAMGGLTAGVHAAGAWLRYERDADSKIFHSSYQSTLVTIT